VSNYNTVPLIAFLLCLCQRSAAGGTVFSAHPCAHQCMY